MTNYKQMDLFCKTPAEIPNDDRIVQMERGTAYLFNQDFPDEYKLFFEVEFTAYETDIETGNEVIKSEMKQTQYMTWKEIQKYALQVTDKWSRTYDHISVNVNLKPLTVLDYFGR